MWSVLVEQIVKRHKWYFIAKTIHILSLKYMEARLISNLHNRNLLLPLRILTSLPYRPVHCKQKMSYNKQLVPGWWKQDYKQYFAVNIVLGCQQYWKTYTASLNKVWQYCSILLTSRAVARMLIGGGCIFIYSCFARQISFQIDQFEFDLKRNSSGRTWIYEFTPPPPPN